MAVLPDRFRDDQRRVPGDVPEHFHAVFLAVDEPVPLFRVERMRALDVAARAFDGRDDLRLHGGLRLLAFLVGGEPQVSVGDEVNGVHA